MSNFCRALLAGSCILAGLLFYHMWPFSRPALLIPLAWWGMYLVNRWHVVNPVLGLIDQVAEKAGYYPVPAKQPAAAAPKPAVESKPQPAPQALPQPLVPAPGDEEIDFDEGTPSVA